jgi:predicted acyl esterase
MRQFVQDGMVIDKDVPIPLPDGGAVLANVFRPMGDGPWPVVLTYGPYGKDVHFSQFMPSVWAMMRDGHPEIGASSSLAHMTFETPDPEVWTAHGYAVVRVDSRGAGKSPGMLQPNSPQEFLDAYEAVEWVGVQPWCTGRVGLLGISYYASGQWMVAQHRPPHLAAIQPWQGTSDFYRDRTRQGGMLSSGFVDMWWNRCVVENQHGYAGSRFSDYFTGERNTGPALEPADLAGNRKEYIEELLDHPLEDSWYRARSADLAAIDVPALVVANWGGLQAHLRGTLLGFEGISSREKWLRVQRGSYFMSFYQPADVATQVRFFDRYLKLRSDSWSDEEPRVRADVRSMDDGVARSVTAGRWPLPRCVERRFHLDATRGALVTEPPATGGRVGFAARGGRAVFSTGPLAEPLVFAGPVLLRLQLASSTSEADVFATLAAFSPDGTEATFEDSTMTPSPVTRGWLRASHRGVDPSRSGFLRPFHHHRVHEPLTPGETYDLEVEMWPASLSLPAGSELRLTITGADVLPDEPGLASMAHDHPRDRHGPAFSGVHTLSTCPAGASYLSLPCLEQ